MFLCTKSARHEEKASISHFLCNFVWEKSWLISIIQYQLNSSLNYSPSSYSSFEIKERNLSISEFKYVQWKGKSDVKIKWMEVFVEIEKEYGV